MLEKEIYGKIMLEPEMDDVLAAKNLGSDHVVEDWPWGRKQRCIMHFFVESKNKKGQRFVKQSTFKGRTNKPKTATYSTQVTIIEIDGKIGHVEWNAGYQMLSVYIEDGKYLNPTFHDEQAQVLGDYFFGM
jgi:hypothetical protein